MNSYMRVLRRRHLAIRSPAVAHLEGGDRLARLGDHGLLPGDQAEIGGGLLDLLAVVDRPSPIPMLMTTFSSTGTCILFL